MTLRCSSAAAMLCLLSVATLWGGELRGVILDAETKAPLPARLYIESAHGTFHLARSGEDAGTAVTYDVQRGRSVETHTCLSSHPFAATLTPGRYRLTAERGKEYHPLTLEVDVSEQAPLHVTLPLRRWINMASRGWYSGETHVHRRVAELPTLVRSEDLNVSFPLTAWVTDSRQSPATSNKNPEAVPPAELIEVDPTHVIWPVNTEYEIFTVDGQPHTLGAVFILNHRAPLGLTAPPVGPIAIEARRQGALLDLDKHNWPWSIMLAPTMKVDLFELTNNHLWRTEFMFSQWYPEYAAEYMGIEMQDGGFTERGWIDFGLQTYYALLNCGFNMQPTAGTASGVHPVPLGYGRVYVHVDGEFSYEKWIEGLRAGHSFVTTGPMLVVEVSAPSAARKVKLTTEIASIDPLLSVEVIVNGEIVLSTTPQVESDEHGTYRIRNDTELEIDGTCWIAVRTFARRPQGRISFAHSAPVHVAVPGKPLLPTPRQRDYLAKRIADEIARNRGVIQEEALQEYRDALANVRALQTRGQR